MAITRSSTVTATDVSSQEVSIAKMVKFFFSTQILYNVSMKNCIFCQIVKGKIPSYKVYEDVNFFAFLDIKPRAYGHTLVIPKKHYRWVYDLEQEDFKKYWGVVLKITKALQKALNPTFITYVTHGLEIEHAHIHVVPRKNETAFVPEIKSFSKEEMEEAVKRIKIEITK